MAFVGVVHTQVKLSVESLFLHPYLYPFSLVAIPLTHIEKSRVFNERHVSH